MLGCEKRNRVYENKWEIIWKRINRVKIKLNDGLFDWRDQGKCEK